VLSYWTELSSITNKPEEVVMEDDDVEKCAKLVEELQAKIAVAELTELSSITNKPEEVVMEDDNIQELRAKLSEANEKLSHEIRAHGGLSEGAIRRECSISRHLNPPCVRPWNPFGF
jgi:hypothetical protein